MKKIVPAGAHLIPKDATKVFHGIIYDVYQWPQVMFDGTTETFEMLKRADTVSVFPVKGQTLVALKQTQPSWPMSKFGFPGGRVDDEDSSPLEAIKRELSEETGLRFKTWKLINVFQREEKIEWFHYIYVASDLLEQGKPVAEAGEKIEIVEVSLEESKRLAKKEARMGAGLIENFNTIEELLAAPEYQGEESES